MFYLILHLKEKSDRFLCKRLHKRSGKVRTIKEVAQQANVSVATVSRVINKSGYVKEATRKRIEQVIKELDYYLMRLQELYLLKIKNNWIVVTRYE